MHLFYCLKGLVSAFSVVIWHGNRWCGGSLLKERSKQGIFLVIRIYDVITRTLQNSQWGGNFLFKRPWAIMDLLSVLWLMTNILFCGSKNYYVLFQLDQQYPVPITLKLKQKNVLIIAVVYQAPKNAHPSMFCTFKQLKYLMISAHNSQPAEILEMLTLCFIQVRRNL